MTSGAQQALRRTMEIYSNTTRCPCVVSANTRAGKMPLHCAFRNVFPNLAATRFRFALACNQSSKIIEPIQSRCAIVRFTKLGEADVLSRLLHVCQQEQARSRCHLFWQRFQSCSMSCSSSVDLRACA